MGGAAAECLRACPWMCRILNLPQNAIKWTEADYYATIGLVCRRNIGRAENAPVKPVNPVKPVRPASKGDR